VPFATGWWGREIVALFPWGMYCGVMLATSIANIVLVLVVTRDRGRLMGGCTPADIRYRLFRAASPGIAFGAGLALLLAHQGQLAQFCWLLIPVLLAVATRFLKPRTSPV
jgi:hypothetical protein